MADKKELQASAKKAAQKIDKLKEEGFKQAHSIFNIICDVAKNVFVVTKTLLGKLFFFLNHNLQLFNVYDKSFII